MPEIFSGAFAGYFAKIAHKAWDTKWRHNTVVTLPFNFFGKNLSNSISTPNFIMIELETTKLGGGGGNAPPPHILVLTYRSK